MDPRVKSEPLVFEDYEVFDNIVAASRADDTTYKEPNYFSGRPETSNMANLSQDSVIPDSTRYVMQSLLYEWGLDVLSDRFATNLIEVRLLEHMREDDIKELCAGLPMRYRIILRQKIEDGSWRKFRNNSLPDHESREPTCKKCNSRTFSMSEKSVQVDLRVKETISVESLIDICKLSVQGRKFLNIYQAVDGKKSFNAECRHLIKKAVVDHFFVLGKGTLHARDFTDMTKIILAELPDEDPRTWYTSKTTNSNASGLLYSRYRYLQQKDKRFKKPKDVILVSPVVEKEGKIKRAWETMPEEQRDACIVSKLTLRQLEVINKDDVMGHWKDSYPLRRYEAITGILKYDEWDVLTYYENVHALITYDFCMTLSPSHDKLTSSLPSFVNRFKDVYHEYQGFVMEDKELISSIWSTFVETKTATDRSTFLALYTLPLILRGNFIVVGRKRFKPMLIDCRNAFITVVKRPEDIAGLIEERRKCDMENETRMNPFIIAVGSIPDGIQQYHVVLEQNVIFPCNTITTALDLAFKLLTVFKIDYPLRCENSWKFVQIFLYDIPHRGRLDPSIASLITDLNRGVSVG